MADDVNDQLCVLFLRREGGAARDVVMYADVQKADAEYWRWKRKQRTKKYNDLVVSLICARGSDGAAELRKWAYAIQHQTPVLGLID